MDQMGYTAILTMSLIIGIVLKIKEKMTERDCTEKTVVQNESPFNICSV
jgi:hypothetical protein